MQEVEISGEPMNEMPKGHREVLCLHGSLTVEQGREVVRRARAEGYAEGRAASVKSLERLEKQLCPALEDPTIKQVVADAAQGLHNIATAIWGLALILMVVLAGMIVVLAV